MYWIFKKLIFIQDDLDQEDPNYNTSYGKYKNNFKSKSEGTKIKT